MNIAKIREAFEAIASELADGNEVAIATDAAVTSLITGLNSLGIEVTNRDQQIVTELARLARVASGLSDLDQELSGRVAKLEALAVPVPSLKLGAPFYVSPDTATSTKWATLLAQGPGKIGLVVFNPATGVGSVANPGYVEMIKKAKAAGIRILCYVPTGYYDHFAYQSTLIVSPDGVKRDPDNLTNIFAELDRARAFYQSVGCDGVFLDEMNNRDNVTVLDCHRKVRDHIRSTWGAGATICWNPGAVMPESFIDVGDLFMRFESAGLVKYAAFIPPAWHAKYSGKWWDCIHSVPAADMPSVLQRAKDVTKPGLIWITDDVLANPYNENPTYLASLTGRL